MTLGTLVSSSPVMRDAVRGEMSVQRQVQDFARHPVAKVAQCAADLERAIHLPA